MFSEGTAALSVGCDSPLHRVLAVWRTFFFNLNFLGRVCGSPQLTMAIWRTSYFKKSAPNDHFYVQRAVTPDPEHSAE